MKKIVSVVSIIAKDTCDVKCRGVYEKLSQAQSSYNELKKIFCKKGENSGMQLSLHSCMRNPNGTLMEIKQLMSTDF